MVTNDDFIKGSSSSKGKLVLKVDMDELAATDPDRIEMLNDTRIICPLCKAEKTRQGNPYYSKRKLYLYKDSGLGYCQRCNTIFVPYFEPNPDKIIMRLPHFQVEDPYEFTELSKIPALFKGGIDYYNNAPPVSNKVKEFLRGRRSDAVMNHWDELKFRAYNDEEVLVPFFWDGEPFFYQTSYCHPKALKYHTPPVSNKPLYILRQGCPTVVLCEGIFDAIACLDIYPNCTIAAVLGKAVTPYQVWMLRRLLPSQIIVYLDKSQLSLNLITQLKEYPIAEYCQFSYVSIEGEEDPDEYLCRINNKTIIK